ncbi:hypothetical protein [Falsiroseomonas selenitidurans]|uniref:Peptidase M28 domain-containing protein n=1 Tax=Falsiroseomonas selenitidurans TaxID=2716335 RepID=A0ABX1E147_9PROT|nr:hypothetical protein [Falsiroseomonas selenitidurans]NKC29257.1 hypothetical protein [Falsiroseomonas selenitidurans]
MTARAASAPPDLPSTFPAGAFFAAYDAFGERRAGSAGDRASARWLCGLAEQAGAAAMLLPTAFQRLIPGAARLETEAGVMEGLPLFDGGLTGPEGVVGTLGPIGSVADIGVAEMHPGAASLPGNPFARARAESRHQGLVIALRTRPDGLAPLNAHDQDRPFGPPVLQLAGHDAARLLALAAAAARARLVVQGVRAPDVSDSVRAALPGAAPKLVLLTPRTSWWTSTAERGGGILAWLTALRALSGAPRSRGVVALASCGHELGHFGARAAFAAEPALARDSHLVIHLGANLGAAEDARLTVRSNVAGLAPAMAARLAAAGYPAEAIAAETGGKANGEAHEIEQRGGRYLSLIGSNPWFHAPEDRWPHSVDAARAEAVAQAVAAMAVAQAG